MTNPDMIAVPRVALKAVLDTLDMCDSDNAFFGSDHYDALRVVDRDAVAIVVNTHGMTPPPQTFRLFDIGGWRMVVEVDSNDDGDGVGIRRTVHVDEDVRMTYWSGFTPEETGDDDLTEACEQFTERVAEMTDQDAADMLSVMLGMVSGLSNRDT